MFLKEHIENDDDLSDENENDSNQTAELFCSVCGTQLDLDAKYCSSCGLPI